MARRLGDSIYVTGTLGSAALGLAILQTSARELDGADGLRRTLETTADQWARNEGARRLRHRGSRRLRWVSCKTCSTSAPPRASARRCTRTRSRPLPGYRATCEALGIDPSLSPSPAAKTTSCCSLRQIPRRPARWGRRSEKSSKAPGSGWSMRSGRTIEIGGTGFRHFS